MIRIAAPLSILAIALAACSSYQPAPTSSAPASTIKPSELPYQAGFGVVQNVKPAPAPMAGVGGSSPDAKSTSSGANTPPRAAGTPMYRLTIKMDNGKIQWVDTDSQEIKTGMRIELTPDRMIKPA